MAQENQVMASPDQTRHIISNEETMLVNEDVGERQRFGSERSGFGELGAKPFDSFPHGRFDRFSRSPAQLGARP